MLVLTTAKAYCRGPRAPHSIWAHYGSREGLVSLCLLTRMLHNPILAAVWPNYRCLIIVFKCLKEIYSAGRRIKIYKTPAVIGCKEERTVLANFTGKK